MGNLRSEIVVAIRKGDIPHDVMFKGEVLTPDTEIDGNDGGPVFPLVGGWVFDGESPIGAPYSTGVEDLRRKLIAAGYRGHAAKLPKYHVIRWWTGPSIQRGFQADDNRFAIPDNGPVPVSTEIIDNLVAYDNHLFTANGMTNGMERLRGRFRGEAVHPIRWAVEAATVARHGVEKVLAIFNANPFMVTRKHRDHLEQPDGSLSRNYAVTDGDQLPDHCVYDVWWDGRTDENVTRYYTEWAKAYGAIV